MLRNVRGGGKGEYLTGKRGLDHRTEKWEGTRVASLRAGEGVEVSEQGGSMEEVMCNLYESVTIIDKMIRMH